MALKTDKNPAVSKDWAIPGICLEIVWNFNYSSGMMRGRPLP